MSKLITIGPLAIALLCAGCGQFFVASSVKSSPDGSVHVFSTNDARVCRVAESGEPVCTQVAKH